VIGKTGHVQATDTKVVSFTLPGGNSAAGMARRSVLSSKAALPATIKHRLALLVSELVTNAIQHGGAGPHETIQIRLASTRRRVRVEVIDPGAANPRPQTRRTEQTGYGLLLVDRLADGWGREETEGGGSVAWFELDLGGLAET
jgi:anti-sigma regulatory factor (Ser/Thr protein kinase)